MANTKNDRVVHELFRSIGERYDMRKLLKAASDSSLSVISEEELHQLLVEHQDQKMALCEGLKKLMVKDDGRLKKFAQFILTYNDPVQKNALATIQQHHRSRSSSGSNTPPSPMDVDSKVN